MPMPDELEIVLGVSDRVAQAIIRRRTQRRFTSLADLESVPGTDAAAPEAKSPAHLLQLRSAVDSANPRPVGMARWVVVFATFVIAAISYLDRNNIAMAATAIQREFDLDNVQLGGVFSAFILGYALTQPVAGRVADRIGASRAIAIAILWWSVFTALLPAIPAGIGRRSRADPDGTAAARHR